MHYKHPGEQIEHEALENYKYCPLSQTGRHLPPIKIGRLLVSGQLKQELIDIPHVRHSVLHRTHLP